jgi:hypothetical protein
MDTEDIILALLLVGLLILSFICLLFPVVLALILSLGYFILAAMIGLLCGLISETQVFLKLTVFVYRPYDPTMNPSYYRIRKFLARKIEKVIVFLLIASSIFCILIELSYYGINILPFNLLRYGVFISNLSLASNIIVIEKIPSEGGDGLARLFLYIIAISLASYGIITFYRGIPEPIYPPNVYPEIYQLQKYLPPLCLSIFNVAASLSLSLTLIDSYLRSA